VRMVVAVREVAVEEEKETCGGMATTGRAAFWHGGGWLVVVLRARSGAGNG
jgi:hypothetical protein